MFVCSSMHDHGATITREAERNPLGNTKHIPASELTFWSWLEVALRWRKGCYAQTAMVLMLHEVYLDLYTAKVLMLVDVSVSLRWRKGCYFYTAKV